MSRVIKFRAWDFNTNKMVGPHDIRDAKAIFPWSERSTFPQYESCPEPHKVEVMQFTGLHDRNGKEIYEGDIVSSKQWNPERQEVVFNRGGFCLKNDESGYYPDIKYAEQMEVIGNIHENKELLP